MADLPANPQPSPGFPSNTLTFPFEGFEGLNTKARRPGIQDQQMAWCDGFMPIGPNNLRTLYDVGEALFTADGTTIVFYAFANLGEQQICLVFLSDGSIVEVDVDIGTEVEIAAPGTLTSTEIGITQRGNDNVIIVANQTNGYFIWDGTNFYQSGTLATQITITDGGSGYTSVPTVTFTGGSGSGAAATAVVENEIVIEVNMTNPGSGYLVGETVTVGFSGGGGSGAAAEVDIMPFGISGTTVEVFTGRVWVGRSDKGFFSAPSSIADFSTANGGGSFESNDSFLRVAYSKFVQSSGFLYLIADSSINAISGVQTSGSPPTTTFSNQNVDPQIGTPYPMTIQLFSRNIVFANSLGVYVLYGGTATKVSDPLDGIYNTVADFGGDSLSGAIANIFAIQTYMVLVPIIDTFTGQQVSKLCMWDGKKWWTSEQSITLTQITAQEINSVLTAWGTDGTNIYPLFQTASNAFTKRAQSKLWDDPSYFFTKTGNRVGGILEFPTLSSDEVTITVDNEDGTSAVATIDPFGNSVNWINNDDEDVDWINDSAQAVTWFGASTIVFIERVGQHGRLLGLTISTQRDDMTLVSATLLGENFQTDV